MSWRCSLRSLTCPEGPGAVLEVLGTIISWANYNCLITKKFKTKKGENQGGHKNQFFRIFHYQRPSGSIFEVTVRFYVKNCIFW